MASESLKDFAVNWIWFGVLFFSLLSFATYFTLANNPTALGDSYGKLSNYSSDVQSNLTQVEGDSNSLLNVTAKTNPEESFLGSRDSVATTFGFMGTAKAYWDSFKLFMGWIFFTTEGLILLGTLSGIFSLIALYWITKWIRTGT